MKKKQLEAIKRMKDLEIKMGLDPKYAKGLESGQRYCVDAKLQKEWKVEDYVDLPELIERIENTRNAYVYHVVESMERLAFLYVSDYEDDWSTEYYYPQHQCIRAYVYNMMFPDWSEIGDIFIGNVDGVIDILA